jgi:hypothetical protein
MTYQQQAPYPAELGVLGRLGIVLYWLFAIIAGLFVLGALAAVFYGVTQEAYVFAGALIILGGLSYLVGIALRYIFTGPRLPRTGKPIATWSGFLRGTATVIAFSAAAAAVRFGQDYLKNDHAGLSGTTRAEFVSNAIETCQKTQFSDPQNHRMDRQIIISYCDCYANSMADRTSNNDLRSIGPTVIKDTIPERFKKVINAASDYCIERSANRADGSR